MGLAFTERRRKSALRGLALAALACAVAWRVGGALFAFPQAGAQLSPAAQSPAAAVAPASARGSVAAPAVQLRAIEDDLPVRRPKKKWEPPFPKYIVGSMLLFGIIGFFGGGYELALVFGISGAGLGSLFEPFQLEDGTISGLD
mmetsp:Transcript_46059/g.133471  ORF Transcript_46059/g.133471 Transcript_46059/m.133471 type:complete len:144 (+) Transcript_46059:88-519(+)